VPEPSAPADPLIRVRVLVHPDARLSEAERRLLADALAAMRADGGGDDGGSGGGDS
jgi:hypothetical protein